jgi:outer membrane protein
MINVFNKFKGWMLLPLLLVAGGAFAELKIAVIDTQRALLESEEAKQLMQSAQSDLQGDQTQLQTLGQDIQKLREQFQKDAEVMSETDRRTRQKEIEDKQIEAEFLANKLQKAVNDRRQELGQQMVPKLEAVLKELTDAEKYDVILERGAILFADPKHDITKRVTEMLNAKKGAAGG